MGEIVPRNDARKIVSTILNRVDLWIKDGNLQRALLELESAQEIDPENVYIQDYKRKVRQLHDDQVGRGL